MSGVPYDRRTNVEHHTVCRAGVIMWRISVTLIVQRKCSYFFLDLNFDFRLLQEMPKPSLLRALRKLFPIEIVPDMKKTTSKDHFTAEINSECAV